MSEALSTPVALVAGGAGFIGTNLALQLHAAGRTVVIADNLSCGQKGFLERHPTLAAMPFVKCDLATADGCANAFEVASKAGTIHEVWHLAANSDIPAGVDEPKVDLKDTFLTTFEILRSMREHEVKVLHFASSSAIYGDLGETVLHEDTGPLLPISNYGAMKLASEAQISAAAESFLTQASLFRFPNVVGVPATHGVIFDFVRKLLANPGQLDVLGDGTQQKSYLHVSDLIAAMVMIADRAQPGVLPVNIGPVDDGITVREIAETVVARVSPNAHIMFGQGNKGWVGDVPRFRYSVERLKAMGWAPSLGSRQAVERATDEIATGLGC